MADDRRPGPSGSRYSSRKRSKKPKPEVVELSDSSSECFDDVRARGAQHKTLIKIKIEKSKKARARKTNGSNSFSKKQRKKTTYVVIELTDSSSENVPYTTAAAAGPPLLKSTPQATPTTPTTTLECPVCLQTCMHPARLPCGHIFCFLCLKGIAQQSHRCAMCRQEISSDYLDRPDLLQVPEASTLEKEQQDEEYEWFYEGRNGWWQYDERTSRELEASYKSGTRTCELLIAGFLYVADFDAMVQMRRNEPHRRRRIKRDLATIPKKGVAGIRQPVNVDTVLEQLSSLTISDNQNDETNL